MGSLSLSLSLSLFLLLSHLSLTFLSPFSPASSCSDGHNHGCVANRAVNAWTSTDPTLATWSATAEAAGTVATYNVEVARVRADPKAQVAAGLPVHAYVMILEIGDDRYLINNATDGDLTTGWFPIPGAKVPSENGGPSIRYSALDGFYYAMLGGHTVSLYRTKDFQTWETSPQNAPFVKPHAADAQVSGVAGFTPAVAAARGFAGMAGAENYTRWDWNSNDCDVRD